MKINFAHFLSFLLFVGCSSGTKSNKTESSDNSDSISVTNEPIKREPIGTEDIDVVEHEFKEFKENKEFSDAETIKAIFDEALVNGKAYSWLRHLTKEIGPRLSGSANAEEAVKYTHMVMDTMGIERVWKQNVMVPHWVRGEKEIGKVLNSKSKGTFEVDVCALGGSIATPKEGITAELIQVNNFKELEELGREAVEGKIVFFNRRMDPRFINTFYAYGSCVDQRWGGAMEAAKYGAVAVLVRSMTLSLDDHPHTGSMGYNDDVPKIPAMSISTNGAVELSKLLKEESLKFFMKQSCETLEDKPSYNVIGEIKGSEFPDEIIIVGGHLDSWDLGEGAHDDGAGCVQSLEVLRLLNEMGVKPKRTIRAVMFMNEENGLRGGKKYAELAKLNSENHIAAIETDRGGFAPRYFSVENVNEEKLDSQMVTLRSWLDLLFDYGIYDFKQGGSGADIGPLKEQGPLLIGLVPESQRYFDYHHAETDVLEAVNERELHMSAAAMASLIYLISEHGI
jgi:hypothetical protein